MAIRRRRLLAAGLAVGLFGAGRAAWCADNLVFVPVTPCRVIDTRHGGGPLAAGTPRTFLFRGPTQDYTSQGGSAGGCGIPDLNTGDSSPNFQNIAKAVAINVVAVNPGGAGDLRAWPAGLPSPPSASILNYAAVAGLNIANGIIVPMCGEVAAAPCANGDITFRADVSGAHLVVDVVGYFHAGSTASTLKNTALGHQALQANTLGANNTSLGYQALLSNTSGAKNSATGSYALKANTSGSNNPASGYEALYANTTTANNTAIGAIA
jgi:hypothetical protein